MKKRKVSLYCETCNKEYSLIENITAEFQYKCPSCKNLLSKTILDAYIQSPTEPMPTKEFLLDKIHLPYTLTAFIVMLGYLGILLIGYGLSPGGVPNFFINTQEFIDYWNSVGGPSAFLLPAGTPTTFYVNLIEVFIGLVLFRRIYRLVQEAKIDVSSKILDKKEENLENIDKWLHRGFDGFGLYIPIVIGGIISLTQIFLMPQSLITDYPIYDIISNVFINGVGYFIIIHGVFISITIAIIIRNISSWELDYSVLDPDRVGGLKFLGKLSLSNIFIYTFMVSWQFYTMFYFSFFTEIPLFNIILAIFLIFLSMLGILWLSLRNVHEKCMTIKEKELQIINHLFKARYNKFKKVLQDNKIPDQDSINIMNSLSFLNDQLEQMRDWPWDTKIFAKLITLFLIPVILIVVEYSIANFL